MSDSAGDPAGFQCTFTLWAFQGLILSQVLLHQVELKPISQHLTSLESKACRFSVLFGHIISHRPRDERETIFVLERER